MNGQFDIGAITPGRYFFGIAILLGLLFALITPASEREWDLVRRVIQWQGQTLAPMAILIIVHIQLHRWPQFDHLNPWFKLCASGVIGALIFSPFALTLDIYIEGEQITLNEWPAALKDEIWGVAPPVIVCWIAINVPWILGFKIESKTPCEPANDITERKKIDILEQANVPPFIELVPNEIRSDIVLLKAELHYLNVVTRKGKALILYNLRDAIDELPSDLGIQPHRSYWVSKQYIQNLQKQGREGKLLLSDGSIVPVSRRRMGTIEVLLS